MITIEIIDIILLVFFILLSLVQMMMLRYDVAGDTYIHLTFARNLATGYGFSYNRGEPSHASTSPLWSLILGVLFKLVGQHRILNVGRIIAGFFHLSSVVGIYFFMKYISPEGFSAPITTMLWALNPNAADWAMRAMETPLFILLILVGAIGLNVFLSAPNFGIALLLGILFGLIILCRPEGWFWVGIATTCLIINMLFIKLVGAGLIFLGIVVFFMLIIVSPYYLWMLKRFGTILPSSKARVLHHRQYAKRLGKFFFNETAIKLIAFGIYRSLFPFAVIGSAALFFEGLALSKLVIVMLLLFSIIIVVFYSFVVPGIDYGYRYILPALPGVIILSVIGMNTLYYRIPFYISLLGSAFIFIPVVWRALKELRRTQNFVNAYVIRQEEPVRQQMAWWVRDNLPEGITIAAKEIDQLAFYSKPGQRILSMDGTIGGEALPYLQNSNLSQFLCHYRPSHLLIEGNIYTFYPFWAASELSILASEQYCSVNGKYEVDGLNLTLLHEEYLYPYADMWGNLVDRRCSWRLFSIDYPSNSNKTHSTA